MSKHNSKRRVYLYLAIGLMLAVGGNSIAGRLLGANNLEKANSTFRQTIVACALVTVVLTIAISVCMEFIAGMFETDALTQNYFIEYYRILIWELPLMILISVLGMFVRGEGKPVFVMLMNLLAVILNVVFDYLCVAKFSLGISGIAWSSFLSTLIILMVFVGYICFGSKIFRFGKFHFSKKVLREMILNGSSEGIGEMSMCIAMAAYNYIVLQEAGINGVSAFTIIGYVSYIFSMIIIGFGQGIVPIVSFAFGAQKRTLAAAVRNTALGIVSSVAVVFFIIMAIFSGRYSCFFTDSTSFVLNGVDQVKSILDTSVFEGKSNFPSSSDIELNDVTFAYEEDENILKDVNLHIAQGERIAFVGESGAGKSTLVQLISRFYDVSKGSIKIGGVDVRDIDYEQLLRNVSVVFQQSFLTRGSIYENIAMGEPDMNLEKVREAAKKAQIDDFIMTLPDRYQTKVGGYGTRFSGGQKQRICIARAILKDAPILILDEATSAADPENQVEIDKAIENLCQKKTVIIVAHRLGIVQNCNRIVVVEKQGISGVGKFEEMKESNSYFAHAWNNYVTARNMNYTLKEGAVNE